ncbi:MAG: hypothetical protein R6U19_07985 [Bacteroidales bacterium]
MIKKVLTGILFLLPCLTITGQEGFPVDFDPDPRGINKLRVMFYNVENLFDTENDPEKKDDEYTPEGDRRWSEYRFWEKVNNLASVIISVGGWEAPAIIGLCEVENRNTLNALFYGTGLKKFNYEIVHVASPDERGIDVALAFNPKKLTKLSKKAFPVCLEPYSSRPTRDILYVKMKTLSQDTIHVLVNHWPSRWGGEKASRPRRIKAASILKSITDSLENLPGKQNILIMGDFNDEPSDKSLYHTLQARDTTENPRLINLMLPYLGKNRGSYFYSDDTGTQWNLLDQFIVSGPMMKEEGLYTKPRAHIFDADFLMTEDNGIKKPYRTYLGFRYIGGYSDHLPVYMDISTKYSAY